MGGEKAIDESLREEERPTPHISGFCNPTQLHALPMHNYADITVPATWLAFLEGLALPDGGESDVIASTIPPRVALLRALWDTCTPTEQGLIIEDMRTFYATPSGEAAGARGDASDDGAAEHGDVIPEVSPALGEWGADNVVGQDARGRRDAATGATAGEPPARKRAP